MHYEFGGPIGTLILTLFLPIIVLALYFLCNKDTCVTFQTWYPEYDASVILDKLFSFKAFILYISWILLHILLERVLPGEEVLGVQLSNSKRLRYVMSGHLQFWITLLIVFYLPVIDEFPSCGSNIYAVFGFKSFPLNIIYDNYTELIFAGIVVSYILSLYLFISSFQDGKLLATGGNSGNFMYDFFMGRELNPRIGSFDLKEFSELRPGLIGWVVINLGMAMKQYYDRIQMYGTGSISASMFLVNLFQGFYVWDALYSEKAILTTMDITTDGFGFMLVFGDLVWVPFTYTLQTRYLVDFDPQLNSPLILCIALIHFIGYYIFRSSNSQKDSFRRDHLAPEVNHLKFIETKRGTRLLVSGWWGVARKINYTGDWLITLSWCLLCGFQSPIPYFQAIYFLILLIHRADRDDKMCLEKYGEDWIRYKKEVPYLFIPFVW